GDPLGQQGHLRLGRTRVRLVQAVLGQDRLLLVGGQSHSSLLVFSAVLSVSVPAATDRSRTQLFSLSATAVNAAHARGRTGRRACTPDRGSGARPHARSGAGRPGPHGRPPGPFGGRFGGRFAGPLGGP